MRGLAYEAADAGLLSPELTAVIRRVKGAKRLGTPLGNWLTAHEAPIPAVPSNFTCNCLAEYNFTKK